MGTKKPQINLQVPESVKMAYDAASDIGGLDKKRLGAAGFIFLLENPHARQAALDRLVAWEQGEGTPQSQAEVQKFVRGLAAELHAAKDTRPSRQVRRKKGTKAG